MSIEDSVSNVKVPLGAFDHEKAQVVGAFSAISPLQVRAGLGWAGLGWAAPPAAVTDSSLTR